MRIPEVQLLKKKNYLVMIRNAVRGENHMFRNVYALVDEVEKDINEDGALACGFFASAVLYLNKLIVDMHTGIAGLENDLAASGWHEISELKEGAILVWEPQPTHLHMGFYIGNDRAVSNGSNTTLMPEEHHYTYDGTRKILRIWWHPSLE